MTSTSISEKKQSTSDFISFPGTSNSAANNLCCKIFNLATDGNIN